MIYLGFKDLQEMLRNQGLSYANRQRIIDWEAEGKLPKPSNWLKFHRKNSINSPSTEFIRIYSQEELDTLVPVIEKLVREEKLSKQAAKEASRPV